MLIILENRFLFLFNFQYMFRFNVVSFHYVMIMLSAPFWSLVVPSQLQQSVSKAEGASAMSYVTRSRTELVCYNIWQTADNFVFRLFFTSLLLRWRRKSIKNDTSEIFLLFWAQWKARNKTSLKYLEDTLLSHIKNLSWDSILYKNG